MRKARVSCVCCETNGLTDKDLKRRCKGCCICIVGDRVILRSSHFFLVKMAGYGRHNANIGSGTATNLALNIFRASVERNRTIVRGSELSPPVSRSSLKSFARANSSTSVIGKGASPNDEAVAVTTGVHRLSADSLYQRRPTHSRISSVHQFTTFFDENSPVASDLVQSIINAAPGSYPEDDGSDNIADRYNFYAHERRFLVQ